METQIKVIAIESIQAAMSSAVAYDRAVTLQDFFMEMNCILDSKTFDKDSTRNMVAGLVHRAAKKACPEFFDFVSPKACMNASGNYTTNKVLWV